MCASVVAVYPDVCFRSGLVCVLLGWVHPIWVFSSAPMITLGTPHATTCNYHDLKHYELELLCENCAHILKNIFLIWWQIVVFQPTLHIFPTNFLFECARGSFTINIICHLKYLITCMIQKVRCCMLTYLPLFRISQLVHCNYTWKLFSDRQIRYIHFHRGITKICDFHNSWLKWSTFDILSGGFCCYITMNILSLFDITLNLFTVVWSMKIMHLISQ